MESPHKDCETEYVCVCVCICVWPPMIFFNTFTLYCKFHIWVNSEYMGISE